MASDPDVCSWILEFLLRQPNVEQWLANELLIALPLPSPLPFRLHKTILLRRLTADLRCPSLRSLHSLELLDDLHYRAAVPSSTSASMSAAYRAVAVHCAADALRGGSSAKILETLCCRVGDLGGSDPSVMDRDMMRGLRVDIDAAMKDGDARAALLGRDTGSEAMEAVRAYLREAVDEFGSSFLEMAANELTAKGIKLIESQEVSLLGNAGGTPDGNSGPSTASTDHREIDGVEKGRQISPSVHEDDSVDRSNINTMSKEQDPTRHTEGCIAKYDILTTPEVEKIINAFKLSCHELKMVMEDPLPKAIAVAAEVLGCVQEQMKNNRGHENIQHQDGSRILPFSITKENGTKGNTEQGGESNSLDLNQKLSTGKQLEGDERNAETNSRYVADADARICSIPTTSIEGNKLSDPLKPNLMDWNPTAHTYEWEDDNLPESSSRSFPTKDRLPSPRISRTSPLKVAENIKFTRRRKAKRWSVTEEDTLRKAVERHGMGNWKTILHCYSDIFQERTEVDLKDKWRNMTRH